MKQTTRVLEMFERYGEITQRDANYEGIMRLAARINDLRKRGVKIETTMRTVINRDGSKSAIAVYRRV